MSEPIIIYKNYKTEMAFISRLYGMTTLTLGDEDIVNKLVDNLYAIDHETAWRFLRCYWEKQMKAAEAKYTNILRDCSGHIENCFKRIAIFTPFADKIEKIRQRAKAR